MTVIICEYNIVQMIIMMVNPSYVGGDTCSVCGSEHDIPHLHPSIYDCSHSWFNIDADVFYIQGFLWGGKFCK